MTSIVKIMDSNEIYKTPAEVNLNNVKHIIRKNENPNPILITIITIIITITMYILICKCIKKKFNGVWIDNNNIDYVIEQSNNKIRIIEDPYNKSLLYRGFIEGNSIYVNKNKYIIIGTMFNDIIYWNDNTKWKKLIFIK